MLKEFLLSLWLIYGISWSWNQLNQKLSKRTSNKENAWFRSIFNDFSGWFWESSWKYFTSYFFWESYVKIFMIDDDTLIPLENIGFVTKTNMSLFDVYYIPSVTSSLNCVGKLCDYNYSITVSSTYFCVNDSYSRRLIGINSR